MARRILNDADYAEAAKQLGCHPAALKAVAEVEAPRGGFLPSGQPTILFERHWFSKLTGRKYDTTYPQISNRKPRGYFGGEAEHSRLGAAVILNREAALMSTSWGKFQIMGFNYRAVHCEKLQDFINAVYRNEQTHLQLFVNFIKTKGLQHSLRALNFDEFAYVYNGPAYKINDYANKMSRYYTKYRLEMV